MRRFYVRLMDALYYLCIGVAGIAVSTMSVIIAWGVFSRYVLGRGSFWPEPISIFLAIQLTFYGAAACYRANHHISLSAIEAALPARGVRVVDGFGLVMMALISLFMVFYGASLVETTFFQAYPEFQHITVGTVYTAIPLAGLITFLFVVERALFGRAAVAEPDRAH